MAKDRRHTSRHGPLPGELNAEGDGLMAYRLLLQVPEIYNEEANVAVASTGDAQVLVTRNSHGMGFDDPYVDMSIAAHSLRVIPRLYQWAEQVGATRQDTRFAVRVVMHDGGRIGLHEISPSQMVAAIRRDQPWVENTMPKIGEHEPNEVTIARRQRVAAQSALGIADASDDASQLPAVQSVIIERSGADFSWDHDDYTMIAVTNIAGAEKFYTEVLGLVLITRLKRDERGNWRELSLAYDREEANYHKTEADRVLLQHGPLRLALARAGHGARLEYAQILTHFSVLVETDVLARIKATVLVRGYDVLEDFPHEFTFRDSYGVAWSVTDKSSEVDR
jgi:catechol 2,3-dioxygenase-like lactoylglutathione lyase family enzyme